MFCEFTLTPTVSNTRILSFSYEIHYILHSILKLNLRLNLAYSLRIHLNTNGHWLLNSFIFLRPSLHSALHTEAQSKLKFCEFTWTPTVSDTRILWFSNEIHYILHSILRLNLISFSANSPESQRSVTLEFLHFAIHTQGQSMLIFCEIAWAPTVSNQQIPLFFIEFLTFCTPCWGSI